MIFQQLFEPTTSTLSYLLGCSASGKAILIDPVESEVEAYIKLLETLGLNLQFTIETHVHADHVTGASLLKGRAGSQMIIHDEAGVACADILSHDGMQIRVGALEIRVLHTPGHTPGCQSLFLGDRVFTGDTLLINGCGRTDFQHGDPGLLYDSIHQKLFTLPPTTLVYPAHDYAGKRVSSIGTEISSNARLGGQRTREQFIDLMNALKLPYPRGMKQALPANFACGQCLH